MKIRLLSDLHEEFFKHTDPKLQQLESDVLVIAGDLNVGTRAVLDSLAKFSKTANHVLYVPGNHEAYGSYLEDFDMLESFDNVHILNPGMIKIDGVTFIGATLWTNFGNDYIARYHARQGISDFSRIKDFNTEKCVNRYLREFEFIKDTYENTEGKKVIITHFLPDMVCIAEQYKGPDLINKYFANELGNWIADTKDLPYWLFGHTHTKTDLLIGDTRLLANPYGYDFNPNFQEVILNV